MGVQAEALVSPEPGPLVAWTQDGGVQGSLWPGAQSMGGWGPGHPAGNLFPAPVPVPHTSLRLTPPAKEHSQQGIDYTPR